MTNKEKNNQGKSEATAEVDNGVSNTLADKLLAEGWLESLPRDEDGGAIFMRKKENGEWESKLLFPDDYTPKSSASVNGSFSA